MTFGNSSWTEWDGWEGKEPSEVLYMYVWGHAWLQQQQLFQSTCTARMGEIMSGGPVIHHNLVNRLNTWRHCLFLFNNSDWMAWNPSSVWWNDLPVCVCDIQSHLMEMTSLKWFVFFQMSHLTSRLFLPPPSNEQLWCSQRVLLVTLEKLAQLQNLVTWLH